MMMMMMMAAAVVFICKLDPSVRMGAGPWKSGPKLIGKIFGQIFLWLSPCSIGSPAPEPCLTDARCSGWIFAPSFLLCL